MAGLADTARVSYGAAMELGSLVDRVYEAAFVPDAWPHLLLQVGETTRSASGTILVFNESRPIRYRATALVEEWTEAFCNGLWKESNRLAHCRERPPPGFSILNRYFTPEFLETDPSRQYRLAHGLDSEIGSAVPMPTGELVVFSFDRMQHDGPHEDRDVAVMNTLHPHLARAGLVAARLGLERARAATETLEIIGLPGAVVSGAGCVTATNALFEQLGDIFAPAAFGRLSISHAGSNRLFQEALAAARGAPSTTRSVPIPAIGDHPACVMHMVPLRHSALDLFPGGAVLLAVSVPRSSAIVPSADVLTGLFDLTPAETRFAAALVSARSPKVAAARVGITERSGRTYLARIFSKTGTHRQSELISLLQSAHPFRS